MDAGSALERADGPCTTAFPLNVLQNYFHDRTSNIDSRTSTSAQRRLNEAAGAAVEGSRSTRFLSERIVGVKAQPFRQEVFRWLRSALFAAA